MTGFPFQPLFVEVFDNSNGSNLNEVSFEAVNKCYDLSYDKNVYISEPEGDSTRHLSEGTLFFRLGNLFFLPVQ